MSKLIFVRREIKPFGCHLISHDNSWEFSFWLIKTRIVVEHYRKPTPEHKVKGA